MKIPKPKALSNRYWPWEKELILWGHSFFWQCVTYVSFFNGVYLRFFFVFRFVFFWCVCFLHRFFSSENQGTSRIETHLLLFDL